MYHFERDFITGECGFESQNNLTASNLASCAFRQRRGSVRIEPHGKREAFCANKLLALSAEKGFEGNSVTRGEALGGGRKQAILSLQRTVIPHRSDDFQNEKARKARSSAGLRVDTVDKNDTVSQGFIWFHLKMKP